MMKRVLLLSTILVLLLSGCGKGSQSSTKGDVIVYVAVPLSGFQANGGQTVLGGVKLAAEEINRQGGLLGYRIVVRPLDDESDSEVAVANVEQIKEAIAKGDHVITVIGHLNSGQTLATMALYKDMPLLIITPTASEQSLTQQGYANFFRVNANDMVQATVDARFLIQYLHATKIAVLHNNTEYGRGLATSLAQEVQAKGAQVVAQIEVKEGQDTYDAEVAQVQAASPDAIFYAGYEIETPYLRYTLIHNNITVPMLASDGAFLAATIDESGGTAQGLYVSAFAPSPNSIADSQWIEAYQVVNYRNPDTYSVNGYVAMQVLADGARQAKSLEASKIAATLHGGTVHTLLDDLTYKDNGDLTNPHIWIYQVQDDEFKQVDW